MNPIVPIMAIAALCAAAAGSFAHWRDHRPPRKAEQMEAMRQALLFYATAENWKRRHTLRRHWVKSPALEDRGARARAALPGLFRRCGRGSYD